MRAAAIARVRRVMAIGLVLHGVAYHRLADETMLAGASVLARMVASASASWWSTWYLTLPAGVAAYRYVERRVADRMPLYLLHEVARLATVLWLSAILALWYPWHRACNCIDFLSETNATVATLPVLAVVLFALGVWSGRRRC